MTIIEVNRVVMPAAVVGAALLLKVWPTVRLRRRARAWPVSRAGWRGRQRWVGAAIGVLNLGQIAWVTLYAALGPAALGVWETPAWVIAAGWALVVVGVAGMAVSQAAMGNSWRMGISGPPGALVKRGPYRWVRHPIYAGWLVMLLGLVLAGPAVWSVVGWTLFAAVLAVQCRMEDRHLARHLGEEHAEYAAATGAVVPGLGRRAREDDGR